MVVNSSTLIGVMKTIRGLSILVPTDYCKDEGVFNAGAVPFLFVS